MARGPIVNYEVLKDDIIRVATEMVKDNGMTSLSIRKISKATGCAVGTIYNAFNSLDEIILTINSATMSKLHKQLEEEAQKEADSFKAILGFAQTYVAFSRRNFHQWSMLVDHKLPEGETVPDWFQKKVDNLFTLVSQVVSPVVDADQEKADRAARVLWASLHGVCSLSVSGKLDVVKSEAAEILADSLVRNYLKGLRTEIQENF